MQVEEELTGLDAMLRIDTEGTSASDQFKAFFCRAFAPAIWLGVCPFGLQSLDWWRSERHFRLWHGDVGSKQARTVQ